MTITVAQVIEVASLHCGAEFPYTWFVGLIGLMLYIVYTPQVHGSCSLVPILFILFCSLFRYCRQETGLYG